MATVASVALTQPSSDPNISESGSFTVGLQITAATHGGLDYNPTFQWDQGLGDSEANYVDIPTSGADLTIDAQPAANQTVETEITATVTGVNAGNFYVRAKTVDNNDSSAVDVSAGQAVTVNAAAAHTGTASQTVPTPTQNASGAHVENATGAGAQTVPTPSHAAIGQAVANGAYGDGANDWLDNMTLSGASSTTISGFIFFNGDSGITEGRLFQGFEARTLVRVTGVSGGYYKVQITHRTSALGIVLDVETDYVFPVGDWGALFWSYDSATQTLELRDHTGANIENAGYGGRTLTTGTIDLDVEHSVFAAVNGTVKFTGEIGPFWFNNELITWSTANIDKVVDSNGYPNLSTLKRDGSGLSGNQPLIFLCGSYDGFEVNYGTGGDFTVNGALTEGTLPQVTAVPTGSGAMTASTPTQSASGTEGIPGSAAQTVPTPTQSATGTHAEDLAGTGQQTAPTPSQSAAAAETISGTANQQAPTPSQSAAGDHTNNATGTAAQTAPTPTQVAAGLEEIPGVSSQVAPTPTQQASGQHVENPTGAGTQTAPTPSQAAAGEEGVAATAAQTVPTPLQQAIASEIVLGSASQTVPTPSQSASGDLAVTGNAAQTAPTPLQQAVGSEILLGSAGQTAPTPTQSGAGASAEDLAGMGAQTVPTPIQNATGVIPLSVFVGLVNGGRMRVKDLALANPLYAGALVRVIGIDDDGARDPDSLPTLYADAEGNMVAANPQTLDSEGKFPRPVYVEESYALEIRGRYAPDHESGASTAATLLTGTSTPEGQVTARPGAIYLRADGGAGTTLYVKETGTGNTGWTAK